MTHLHIFALTEPCDQRHTHLTRARNEAADLPPLRDWLGVGTLHFDDIELFPVADLDDMRLSDYITTAFAPEQEIPRDDRAKMDVLDGSVLLVPGKAIDSDPQPGAELTLIATIPLAQPDHSADLPKVDVAPLPKADTPETLQRARNGSAFYIMVGISLLILLYLVFGA